MKMILKNKQFGLYTFPLIKQFKKANYFDGVTIKLNFIEQRRTWTTKLWHAHAVT